MPKLSGIAMKRLVKEWERLRDAPGDCADAVKGGPLAEEDMSVWSVKCTNLDHADASPSCKAVAMQLKEKGHEPAIEFRLHFPDEYPAEPPFVYVHSPLITGGHIHGQGAMCLDVLHPAGWTPATKVDSLLRTIRSDLDNMALKDNWFKSDGTLHCNSALCARKTAEWIARAHGDWAHARAEPHRPSKRPRAK